MLALLVSTPMSSAPKHGCGIQRVGKYLEVPADLEKPPPMFRNVVALRTAEFEDSSRKPVAR